MFMPSWPLGIIVVNYLLPSRSITGSCINNETCTLKICIFQVTKTIAVGIINELYNKNILCKCTCIYFWKKNDNHNRWNPTDVRIDMKPIKLTLIEISNIFTYGRRLYDAGLLIKMLNLIMIRNACMVCKTLYYIINRWLVISTK